MAARSEIKPCRNTGCGVVVVESPVRGASMIPLQRCTDPKHIHWPPVESNKTRVHGIAPVLIGKSNNGSLKIPHGVIIAETQRRLFADLPHWLQRKSDC